MQPETTRRNFLGAVTTSAAIASLSLPVRAVDAPPLIRLGIIGLDTSHVTVFTKYFNGEKPKGHSAEGIQIVAAFPAGNPEFPLSRDRIAGFTKEVRGYGVEIVPSLQDLLSRVDGVLLESVDGTQHREQVKPVFDAGKPVFIDKPLAASLVDVLAIEGMGKKSNVPWFTASSSRFTAGYPELRNPEQVGDILGCDTYSQSRAAAGHPDLFWYGVHGIDLLYSLMGTGCQSVTALQTSYSEHVTGLWSEGRVGTYRSIREHTGKTGLGATVFGTKGIVHCNSYYDYNPLADAIARFFRTGVSPVSVPEMVEVFAYLAAAEESKQRKGIPVMLKEVIESARTAMNRR